MTKAQYVAHLASEFSLTKKLAGAVLDYALAEIGKETVSTGRFSWPGFGVWTLRRRKERTVRNPKTRELMTLGPLVTIGFRPAKELKDTFQRKDRRTA
jgi:DNA-binding protein HU-beta